MPKKAVLKINIAAVTESIWQRAAGLERCAIGWRLDAQRYRGRRREWRMERADRCEVLAYRLLGLEV